ncbi:MAG TPA: glycosyltransferase family 39 protein [Mycobacteriales bacterium]|nr:glycosyltransferase family 39 protein [Mycobacteriales bacterium]
MAAPGTDTAAAAAPIGVARRPLLAIAGAVALLLVATSWRYGYHRDELYFIVAGQHPDWGYPDQPPLTPVLARLMDLLGGGSLVVLRLPSALAAGATALLAGLTAHELGGRARAQLIAAACVGVSGTTLVTGHIVSTTTYDVLFSTTVCWLLARAVRTRENWLLLPAGLALGLGLLNKSLVGVLVLALAVGVVVAGPRRWVRSGWLAIGAVVALVCLAPYLVWQALNGWPELEMGRSIAGGGDQGGRLGFLPFQLLLVSPLLVPVWVAGLVWLLRSGPGRPFRFLGIGYLLLAAVYLVAGGKAYYLAGMYPALLAAGAVAIDGRLGNRARATRPLAVALVLSLVVGAVVGLAVLPARALGPVLAVNPDAGEQVAWPRYVAQIAGVWNGLTSSQRETGLVLTRNYGEAGAIDRYGAALGLPRAYSGHNGFAEWAVPAGQAGPVVLVGYPDDTERGRLFGSCQQQATLDNGLGLDTEEQGVPVWVCGQPARPWADTWPEVRHLN